MGKRHPGNQGIPAKKKKSAVASIPAPAKPVDAWLQLGSIVVGVAFWLVPDKTPRLIIGVLLLCFGLIVHPVWNFWWIEKHWMRRVLALLSLAGALWWLGSIAWPVPRFFSVQLEPPVEEESAVSTEVSGMTILAWNSTWSTVRDLGIMLPSPPISESETDGSGRTIIEGGGMKNGTFIHVIVPELLPAEHHEVRVRFLKLQPFKTSKAWAQEYGYPDYLQPSRMSVGKEH